MLEDSAATYRLLQGLGSSICSWITPLFVSDNSTASTPSQLRVEMIIAAGFSIISYILLLVFLSYSKKNGNK